MSDSKHLNHLPTHLFSPLTFSFYTEKYQKCVRSAQESRQIWRSSWWQKSPSDDAALRKYQRVPCWFWKKLMQRISALLLLTTFPSFPSQRNVSAPLNSMTSIVQAKSVIRWLRFPARYLLLGDGPVMPQGTKRPRVLINTKKALSNTASPNSKVIQTWHTDSRFGTVLQAARTGYPCINK